MSQTPKKTAERDDHLAKILGIIGIAKFAYGIGQADKNNILQLRDWLSDPQSGSQNIKQFALEIRGELQQCLEQSIANHGPIQGQGRAYRPYQGNPIAKGGYTRDLCEQHGISSPYDLFAKFKEQNGNTPPNDEARNIQAQIDYLDQLTLELGVNYPKPEPQFF